MDKNQKPDLSRLHSLTDVAELLQTSVLQLRFLLYGRSEKKRYSEFLIPKRRGGHRMIEAPKLDLKILQKRFAGLLTQTYDARQSVHGFTHGRSIATNADVHVGKRSVLNVDLLDFFPSINFGRVRGLFMAAPMNVPEKGATILAQLCCHNGRLPQGAPTSPIISNMICARMDKQLLRLARAYQATYTRYVDDMSFSKQRDHISTEIGFWNSQKQSCIGDEVQSIIESNGFQVNPRKVHLTDRTGRQEVTGLVVNSKRNVKRSFIRQIRAMIHAWERYGLESAEQEHWTKFYGRKGKQGGYPPYVRILCGKLEFLKMIRGIGDPVYRNLQTQLVKVYPDYLTVMRKENRELDQRDIFICHASEDKVEIARPLADALVRCGVSVWYDDFEIKIGDDILKKVDEGLTKSRYGVPILSKDFFSSQKTWTDREIGALTAREDVDGRNLMLPLWHNIEKKDVVAVSPILARLKAIKTHETPLDEIVTAIKEKIQG